MYKSRFLLTFFTGTYLQLRNNSTVFEELEVSIVDLTVANVVLLATRSGVTVFTVFRLLTDFVCLYTYEFWLSLCRIARSSVILLLPLFLWNSPNMYILVWKHTNNWRNICTFQIPSAKKKFFNKWFKKNNYFESNKFYICNIVSSKKYKSHKNYYYLSIL